MTDSAAQADTRDAAPSAALARWASDPGLAPIFSTPEGPLLVLDAAGERVLHASAQGARLRAGIAAADGAVDPALRLAQQLRHGVGAGPRLVRIRFDARGIARPTACLIATATTDDGAPVLLLAPKEPLPPLRPLALPPRIPAASDREPVPTPEEPAGNPAPTGRLTWGSDAQGVLTRFAGAEPVLVNALCGQAWQSLAASGTLVGPELLAALEARRTFRGLSALLRPPAAADEIVLDLSGAPSARPTQAFAGFAGFGLVRERRPRTDRATAVAPAPDTSSAQDAGEPPADPVTTLPAPLPEAAQETPQGVEPQPVSIAEAGCTEREDALSLTPHPEPADETANAPRDEDAGQGPDAVPAPMAEADDAGAALHAGGSPAPAAPQPDASAEAGSEPAIESAPELADAPAAEPPRAAGHADLSTHEHAAFREIARALGARFAGDEAQPDAAATPAGAGGAVMAFPAQGLLAVPLTGAAVAVPHPATDIDAAIVAALDRLPAGVIVHRAHGVLFANRRFLELAGYPDKASLRAAAGLAPLYELASAGRPAAEPVSIGTGRGGLLALSVERSVVDWDGSPAELLLVREASDGEPVRARIAKELAQGREDGREREARILLDHAEEGIAALDEAGRVLGLNRSAAALLSAEPREIVGGTLADLLVPQDAAAVAQSFQDARGSGSSRPLQVSPRARREGGGRLRLVITRLPGEGGPRFCAGLREGAGATPVPPERRESLRAVDLLAHVGREVRSPIDGILGLADGLLAEAAPPATERLREALRAIRASGEQAVVALDDLQNLASIEAGSVALTFTDIALNDVISGCIAQMQPQATRERIVVRTSLSPDLKPLLADERLMRQAALNVIAEALRATEPGGQVIVSTTNAERGEIALRVRHTGAGMTPEEIENALRPAPTAAPAAGGPAAARQGARETALGRGSLGLTLTKALVEANRGRFRIVSGKSEGTLVEMLFPPVQARSA